MRKYTVRDLTLAAMVAALYAALGYFGDFFSLTFGPVQLRFAEALTVLPFLFPATAPGLAVGCLITNLLSPYGPLDIIFGTLATAVAAAWTAKVPRWYLAGLPPVLVNAIVLPPIWAWTKVGALNGAFWTAWAFDLVTFVIAEAAVCYLLGGLLLTALPKIKPLEPLLLPRSGR